MDNEMQAEATARDFDFWMSRWNVHNRRLRKRLAGADEWDEFEATVVARPILGGMGNEGEFRTDYNGGFIGMSFRFFDPAKKQWSIYWADTRRCGELDPPVFGTFSGDIGLFEGTDVFEGPCGSPGRASPHRHCVGSRPSPTAAARPGRRTGSWKSHGPKTARELLYQISQVRAVDLPRVTRGK